MDPILDIRPVRPGRFTYSLRAPGQPPRPCDDFFDSLGLCVGDASCGLLNYFDHVQVHVHGLPVGRFAVARMASDRQRVAGELRERFACFYGERRRGDAARRAAPCAPTLAGARALAANR